MRFIPILLAVLAIAVHGRPRLAARDGGKMCSRWMTEKSARNLRSTYGSLGHERGATIERRGSQARVCHSEWEENSSESDFPTECGKQKYQPHRKRIVGGSEARPNSWVRNELLLCLRVINHLFPF